MSDKQKELVSALMDGELGDFELRRLLKQDGEGLDAIWSRYHTASRALRDEAQPFANLDVSARVSAEIAALPTAARRSFSIPGPLVGLAVAAGVAAVVVLGSAGLQAPGTGFNAELADSQPLNRTDGRAWPATASNATGNVTASASAGAIPALAAAQADSEARARFQRQMLRHTRRVVDNTGYGMLSYARVVYEVEE